MLRSIFSLRSLLCACFLCGLFSAGTSASAASEAADFPPGAFSDGGKYKLADFEGKVLVLFFYEQGCPTCRGLIPERNKVVDQFKDQPVKFIAVAPGDTLVDAIGYTRSTHLKMPAFSDLFGVMQTRYGFSISLRNIYQFRIIGPKGNIVGMSMEPAAIEKALSDVKWKYKDGGYDKSLNTVIDMLEWNQYEPAVRQLKISTKAGNKTVAESATKLMDAVKAEGKGWLDEAAKASETDPIKAYDLYKKVSAVFAGDEMAKTADAALKTLAKDKTVVAELAARTMYDQLGTAAARAQMTQKPVFIKQAQAIATKYPDTATGKKAKAFAEDLEKATAE
jgi:thiol-disulfide isomerase/thioredoxin